MMWGLQKKDFEKKKRVKKEYCEEKFVESVQEGRLCDQKERESNIKKKTWNRRRER